MIGAVAASRRRSVVFSGPVELVVNGQGNSAGGWSDLLGNGVGSVSSVGGRLRVTSSYAGAPAQISQDVPTTNGARYAFKASMFPHDMAGGGRARVMIGGENYDYPGFGGSIDVTYVATGSTTRISLIAANNYGFVAAGEYAEFDDISLIAA